MDRYLSHTLQGESIVVLEGMGRAEDMDQSTEDQQRTKFRDLGCNEIESKVCCRHCGGGNCPLSNSLSLAHKYLAR